MKKPQNSIILLVVLFITEALLYYISFKDTGFYDHRINTADSSCSALDFYQLFCANIPIAKILKEFFSYSYIPRLHGLFTGFFLFLFGGGYLSMAMINVLYLGMLIFSTYGIAFKLTEDQLTGILSAAIVSFFPGTVFFMQAYEVQIGTLALVTLAVYFIVLSNYFTKTRYVILFSLTFCLSMYMTRVIPAIFVIGPFIYLIRQGKPGKKCRINLLLSLFLILIILYPFYHSWIAYSMRDYASLRNLFSVGGCDTLNSFKDRSYFSLHKLSYYIQILPQYYLGIFWFLIFITVVVLCAKTKRYLILVWWMVPPLVFFTVMPKKDYSYIIPSLSAIAIIISVVLLSFRNTLIKRTLFLILVFVGVTQFTKFLYSSDDKYRRLLIPSHFFQNECLTVLEFPTNQISNIKTNQWLYRQVKSLNLQKKSSMLIMQTESGLPYDYELAVFIISSNPGNRVFVSSVPRAFSAFTSFYNDNKVDYVILIKNINSDVTLDTAKRIWLDLHKITQANGFNFHGYRLFSRTECPYLPIEMEIYKYSVP